MAFVRTTEQIGLGVSLHTWIGDSYGAAIACPVSVDKTVHISGTFDSRTVVIEGSMDGTNYVTLKDPQGLAMSYTSADMEVVLGNPLWIRPKCIRGEGLPNVTIVLLIKRAPGK